MDKEPENIEPKTLKKALFLVGNFGSLIWKNLLHIWDTKYVPEVDPWFEVVARTLDKMPIIPFVTMLVQACTWRNILWGKLAPVNFFKYPMPGQRAMA